MPVNVILGGLVDISQHCASHRDGHVFSARVAAHLAVEGVDPFEEGGVCGGECPHLFRLEDEEVLQPSDVERVLVGCCLPQLDCKRQLQ